MAKASRQDRTTAFHEAGHAVLAFLLERRIRTVTIIPNHKSGYAGVTKLQLPRSFHPDCYDDQRHRMIAEVEIMIRLAGGVAQAFYQRKRWSWKLPGTGRDVESIYVIANYFAEGNTLDAWMKYLVLRVTDMLKAKRNWRLVKTLAHELVIKKKMSGTEAHQFILETIDSEFQEQLRKEGRPP